LNDSVSFNGSKIVEQASFSDTQFIKDANFIGTQFCKVASFGDAVFEGTANFYVSRFYGPAYFSGGVLFKKGADFSGSQFNRLAYFWANFMGDASFVESEFNGRAFFALSSFNKRMILDNSRIRSMNLSATFNEGSTISLKHSEFFRLEVPWIDIKDKFGNNKDNFDGSTYLALVKNYNNLEWFDDADACYDQYRIKKSMELKGVKKLTDCLVSFYFYGYGVHPEYPLAIMAVIFIASALVYFLDGQVHSITNAAELSAVILTTTTQIDSLTGICRCWSIGERILGWLLMSSFLVVLTKKTIR
jgi:hypothetical protein